LFVLVPALFSQDIPATSNRYEFNDAHFHLTNYIQEGISIQDFLNIMGTTTGRSALFGIPLQQQWSYHISGNNAPTYYLQTDAPLYYYSFTDAVIAEAYLSLSPKERKRFDPMITGFNPTDMYGADHIRRVLQTYPGVFSGIGEFTIHKEFVSEKVAGGVASLLDPALDRILSFAEDSGLAVLIHNDVDIPLATPESDSEFPLGIAEKVPAYLEQMKTVLRRHPGTTIIWAHTGVGRIVRPVNRHMQMVEDILKDPAMSHVMFDISWEEVAKYIVASPESLKVVSDVINRYPDRFLFGTDAVAPKSQQDYLKAYRIYDPLWAVLSTDASLKVRKTNYERVFDEAAKRVRTWEAANHLPPASTQVLPLVR
jgi:predicted TIM-barrel fold metal-dependent hydrolase